MFIPSYLLLFLLTALPAYGYTVVLAGGKTFEGTLVTEQQNTIVIRDSQGVCISFKKSKLDLRTMAVLNHIETPSGFRATSSKPRSRSSIVELAAETRRKRTGKAKSMSLDDLDRTSRLSILGSEQPDLPPRSISKAGPAEREWSSRLWALKKEVNRLREKRIAAATSCEETKQKQHSARTTPSQKPVELMDTFKESAQCRKSAELDSQLEEAVNRLENLREEARRAGVSWQTLE